MNAEQTWPPKTLILPAEEWSFEILEIGERGEEYEDPNGFVQYYPLQQVARIKVTPKRPDLDFLLSGNRLRRWFLELDDMVFTICHVVPSGDHGIAHCQRPVSGWFSLDSYHHASSCFRKL